MRPASRFMPKHVRKRHWPAWVALAILALVPVYFLLNHPVGTSLVIVSLLGLSIIEHRRHTARLKSLAESRAGESICEFARSFERTEIDTWGRSCGVSATPAVFGRQFLVPIRATDRLKEDLAIDADDLEMDLMAEISRRAGRSLSNTTVNPYYDRVKTTGDLVLFFNAQPKDSALFD